jgi:hypothetical protein
MKTQFILSIAATFAAWYIYAVSGWNVALWTATIMSVWAVISVYRFLRGGCK